MKKESYFKTHDRLRLYYERHEAKRPKAILAFVHGLNEHSGRYQHVVEHFTDAYTCYFFDLRGHGRSDGERAYVKNFDEFVKDVAEYLKLIRSENKTDKIFLVAHSLGGQIALNYLGQYADTELAGFITSSANIRIGWKINPIKKALCLKLSQYLPKIRLPREVDVNYISHDAEVVKAYTSDPLVNQSITLSLAKAALLNQDTILSLAPKIKLPALMMHAGDDHICACSGSEDFFKKLASKDKTLKIYPGFYHELFNEIGKEEVFRDIHAWLDKRSGVL